MYLSCVGVNSLLRTPHTYCYDSCIRALGLVVRGRKGSHSYTRTQVEKRVRLLAVCDENALLNVPYLLFPVVSARSLLARCYL